MKTVTIMVVALALFLGGCGVSPEEIEKANSLCEPNGGLSRIHTYPGILPDVKCNNGAFFTDVQVDKK